MPTSGPPGTVAGLPGKLCVKMGLGTSMAAKLPVLHAVVGSCDGESISFLTTKKSLPLLSFSDGDVCVR